MKGRKRADEVDEDENLGQKLSRLTKSLLVFGSGHKVN